MQASEEKMLDYLFDEIDHVGNMIGELIAVINTLSDSDPKNKSREALAEKLGKALSIYDEAKEYYYKNDSDISNRIT